MTARTTTLFRWCPPEPVFPAARCGSCSPRPAAVAGRLLLVAGPVGAQQASLVESSPADGEELDAPPSQIVLTFDGELGERQLGAGGVRRRPVLADQPARRCSDDRLTLTVEVTEPMPVGRVQRRLAGQPAGRRGRASATASRFTVLASTAVDPTATTVAGATTTDRPHPSRRRRHADDDDDVVVDDASEVSDGATWLGGVLSTLGLAVLFGSLALIIAAWPEGPEYILAVRFLRSVWLLTLVGTLLYVVALSAAVRGESFGSGLNPAGWLDLLDAGWSGRAALARLVLVVACVWVVLRPERVIDPTTQLPAIAIPTLAVVTLGLARTGR